MTDKDLKKVWKDARYNDSILFNHQKILNDMNNTNQKLDKQLKWRNFREIGAAIFVMIGFLIVFFLKENYIVKFAAALAIPIAIFIIFKLLQVRSKRQSDTILLSIKDQLIHRKIYLQHEQALLKNVTYWYLLPIAIQMIIMEIGFGTFSLLRVLIFAALFYGVYVFNQKGAKKFDPHIKEIEHAIEQLESD